MKLIEPTRRGLRLWTVKVAPSGILPLAHLLSKQHPQLGPNTPCMCGGHVLFKPPHVVTVTNIQQPDLYTNDTCEWRSPVTLPHTAEFFLLTQGRGKLLCQLYRHRWPHQVPVDTPSPKVSQGHTAIPKSMNLRKGQVGKKWATKGKEKRAVTKMS